MPARLQEWCGHHEAAQEIRAHGLRSVDDVTTDRCRATGRLAPLGKSPRSTMSGGEKDFRTQAVAALAELPGDRYGNGI